MLVPGEREKENYTIEVKGETSLKILLILKRIWQLPRWLNGTESICQCRRSKRHKFDPWVRNPLGEEMTTHSSPGKSHDRGAWQVAVHGVTKSQTWLSTHEVKNMKKYSEELLTSAFGNLNRMDKFPEEIIVSRKCDYSKIY